MALLDASWENYKQVENGQCWQKLASRLQSAAWKNPAKIEDTARDTLQQNSPVERAFYALAIKVHATMHHANLPMEIQYQLFCEIFTTVTLLDGLTVIELNGKHASRFKHLLEKYQGLHTVCAWLVRQEQEKSRMTPPQNWRIREYIAYFLGILLHTLQNDFACMIPRPIEYAFHKM